MTDSTDRSTALVPDDARALDAHGFDPAAYDWIPVRRVPRVDGWSEEKQRAFIGQLADTGSVALAARAVGMSVKSAYALRRAPDGGGFARAWAAAVRQGMNRLVDECLERSLHGSEEPVWDREGRVIGHRRRYHDRMAMFLLRAHMPELFGDRARGAAPPPPPEPVSEAVRAIDPVTPDAPHALMAPAALDVSLRVADLLKGELPRERRDRDLLEREREERAAPPPSPARFFADGDEDEGLAALRRAGASARA